jgi:hypothetical protein
MLRDKAFLIAASFALSISSPIPDTTTFSESAEGPVLVAQEASANIPKKVTLALINATNFIP